MPRTQTSLEPRNLDFEQSILRGWQDRNSFILIFHKGKDVNVYSKFCFSYLDIVLCLNLKKIRRFKYVALMENLTAMTNKYIYNLECN